MAGFSRSIRRRRPSFVPLGVQRSRAIRRSSMAVSGARFMRRAASSNRTLGARVAGSTRAYLARAPYSEYPIFSSARPRLAEQKAVAFASALIPATSAGSILHVNPIAQGDSIFNRQGSRLLNQAVQLRGFLAAGTTGTVCQAVLLLVWDRSPAGVVPAITDIVTSVATTAFQNPDTRDRYKLLGRWQYSVVGNSTTPTVGSELQAIDLKVSFNLPTSYLNSGLGVIAQVSTGAIYLIAYSDVVAGTNAPNFTLAARTVFADA